MYLKALTLRGFKSFATSTTLKFEPGITCIVGPNGSGKSNVVDALAWVMGEQGAKSLRGGAMADVIFAGSTGSSGRQGLGRAQVELTIDNSDARLPIDYTEVTMSRTLFRGGASEYAINQSPVRLLDVQELLSDTGMGRQMHVIVGQGQLDAVLNATAEERRAFIDEAAGVLKHRRRKERALRKLEAMDQNLVRVLDLTEEMRRQLKPLARQAKAAREASGVQARITYARRRLVAAELVEVLEALRRSRNRGEVLARQVADLEKQAAALQDELTDLNYRQAAQRRGAEKLTEQWHGLRQAEQRFESLAQLARERVRRAGGVQVPVSAASIDLARERVDESVKEREAAEAAQQVAANNFELAQQAATAASAEAEAKAQALQEAERELNRKLQEQTRIDEELTRAKSRVGASQEAVAQAAVRLEEAQVRAKEARQERENAQPSAEAGLERETAAHEAAIEFEQGLRQAVEELTERVRSASEQLATWQARSQVLAESIYGDRGTEKGQSGGGSPSAAAWKSWGRLGDRIRVARGWEDAVAALLEPYGEADLVEHLSAAQAAEELAKTTEQSVFALVAPPSSGPIEPLEPDAAPASSETDAADPAGSPTGVVRAVELVQADPTMHAVLRTLLKDAFVAVDVQAGVDWLTATDNADARVGTASGSVLTTRTIRTRGQSGASTLKLRADLEHAAVQTHEARAELQAAEQALEQAKAELVIASEASAEKLRALRALDAKQAEQAKEFAKASALAAAAEQELERAQTQLADAEAGLQAANEKEGELAQKYAQRDKIAPDTFLAEPRAANAAATEQANLRRDELAEARLALHSADERLAVCVRQVKAFETQLGQLQEDRARQLRQFEAANAMKQTAASVLEAASEAKDRARKYSEKLGVEREKLAEAATLIEREIAQIQGRAGNLEERRRQLVSEQQQAEVSLAQLQYQFEQVQEKARELVDSPITDAADASATAPDGADGARAEVESEANPALTDPASADTSGTDSADSPADSPVDLVLVNGQPLPTQVALPDLLVDLIRDFGPDNSWPIAGDPQEVDEDSEEPQWQPFSRQVAAEALERAQRELARLGVVNPLAIEEYEALKTRHDFLMDQVEDLNRSKADLMKIIRDVDQRVRESFQQAFEDVSAQYEHVFSVLFPGGSGKLMLTDPDDPLHTGVEIEARPAGKKVTRMSLLSGGERSLASLAYLFAIFKARPSPFYVLDEVEAALDDINLSRVLQIFKELQQEAQLLIVTHQKRTMQIADALYGITMRDGVTTVISHKMQD